MGCTQGGGTGRSLTASVGVRRVLHRQVSTLEVQLHAAEIAVAHWTVNVDLLWGLQEQHKEADARLCKHEYHHYMMRQHPHSDRSGRLLAWLVKETPKYTPVGAFRLDSGVVLTTQADLNTAFSSS
ncbi:hypothetical protein NDU88_004684 [Pleurodeles waltl]|uniref:Uncharacterized protein n=1 Tax=Pleurodeles waltl TaxID=8319 RepID=A0AAV7W9A4_PLEWA|nr:hypothetical protein NDU88_004684 [Pleurodeles waltl]